jgi:prolyl-tRNA synthetase
VTDPVPFAQEVAAGLRAAGLRVHVDTTEDRPGAKYYHWELVGVPLRLDIGGREAAAGTATAVDRLGTKTVLGPGDLVAAVSGALGFYESALYNRAVERFHASFERAEKLAELTGSKHVRVVAWCGKEECGHQIETAIDGALLGTLETPLPTVTGPAGVCIACGTAPETRWALAAQPL